MTTRRQIAAAFVAVAAVVMFTVAEASANDGGGAITTGRTRTGAGVQVRTAGDGGGAGASGASGPRGVSPFEGCVADRTAMGAVLHPGSALPTTPGTKYWNNCTRTATGAGALVPGVVAGPPPPPPADAVAAEAASTLQLDLPTVATAPPSGGLQLVGVEIWFWVTNNRPAQATATVPGLSATVTATASGTHLAFADGTRVDCPGGGTPYDRGRPGRQQHSTCARAFRDRGRQRVDVTVDWTLAWTASNGEAGVLPALGRTTTVVLAVQEGQAVTD